MNGKVFPYHGRIEDKRASKRATREGTFEYAVERGVFQLMVNVCESCGISPSEIYLGGQTMHVARARRECVIRMHNERRYDASDIARIMGKSRGWAAKIIRESRGQAA